MEVVYGVGISDRVLFGQAVFFVQEELSSNCVLQHDVQQELMRLRMAIKKADVGLATMYEDALSALGRDNAMVLQAYRFILNDEAFVGKIEERISSSCCSAEYAVFEAENHFVRTLAESGGEYVEMRVIDVKEICLMLINCLSDKADGEKDRFFRALHENSLRGPFIVVSREIFVTDILRFPKCNVKGFVTKAGSEMSHVAILAKALGLVAIVGTGRELQDCHERRVIISAGEDVAIFSPNREIMNKYMVLAKGEGEEGSSETGASDCVVSETPRSCDVKVLANISCPEEASRAINNGADGIGLFRSEFLFMEKPLPPDEEEQFLAYKALLEVAAGRTTIIRTIDVGADKVPLCFKGWFLGSFYEQRGIRFCLKHIEIFKVQLRALLRAGSYGALKIMLPMITSVDEVVWAKNVIEEVKRELRDLEIEFCENFELGIMIETPAAVMLADKLAVVVDFFSIGTNDLAQLAFAVDRNSEAGAGYCANDVVVFRMVNMVVKAAKMAGIATYVCGVCAEDKRFVGGFVALGVSGLSVGLGSIGDVAKEISNYVSCDRKDILKDKI
ncbi:MAG: phosphoenolpyruvate--protein phosphotransferase [Oscillospiraceae bacterium]|jgi:phosphotransferase system enzyme I (PtsI)|nr:phosphoenolpyruvate--protein phosphotransferase [Oscillospiraceae bacterium]